MILAISDIIKAKENSGRLPMMAYYKELRESAEEDLKSAINEHIRCKVLEWHSDINGNKMFEFTPPK